MSLRERAARAAGVVRTQGARWVAERLVLEGQKRLGYEARVYAPADWRGDAWTGALDAGSRGLSPDVLLTTWRKGTGHAWGRARDEGSWRNALLASLDVPAATSRAASASASASASTAANATARESLLARAEAILAGRFTLFSRHEIALSFPPPWDENPLRGPSSRPPHDRHWSRLGMEGAAYGDLKFVWELSRGAWAFILARAYAASSDERFAEGFWQLWIDWIERHPPHRSVQWKCGQECALRLIAVSFAVQICARAAATTPARFARHLEAMARHAERIARGGWYARLQNNNHSMSEAAGLYTAGVFYPMLEEAPQWRAHGWRHLEEEAVRLLRPDGTFSQKSHNYHRLMLHDYLWASSVAEVSGDVLEPAPRQRLRAAVDNLEGVVDPRTGGVPNFGSNDGALILVLDEAPYTDFRSVLRAATFWREGGASAETARDAREKASRAAASENVLWLFGARASTAAVDAATTHATSAQLASAQPASAQPASAHRATAPADTVAPPSPPATPPRDLALPHGGIYTLRQDESWVFTHAEDLRDRPGQADLLHVDLWWRGENIARDPGTYLYYGDQPSFAWFKGSRCHNTVTVDGREQMEPGPRFLWASRAHAQARVVPSAASSPSSSRNAKRSDTDSDSGAALILHHDGYHRLPSPVTHVRAVRALGKDTWLVYDELGPLGESGAHQPPHVFTLHWLLPDVPASFLSFPTPSSSPTPSSLAPSSSQPSLENGCDLALTTPAGTYFVQVVCKGDEGRADHGPATFDLLRAAEGPELWGWESRHYGEKTPALSLRARTRGHRATFLTLFSPIAPTEPLAATAWLDDNHLRL